MILVRHGRTALNASGLLQGQVEEPLDEVGRAQAARVAAALPMAGRLVASPLRRTVETAEAIAPDIEVDERFIELDYGEFEGRPVADIPLSTWTEWRRDPEFAPPGGESLRQLAERVVPALVELSGAAMHEDIIVVTHVSPIKAAVVWALGVDEEVAWRCQLSPASITRIGRRGETPLLVSFNEVGHLD